MPLITLRDIQLSYGQQPLLDHVTLSIDPGERLCLIGRNGAGKSTLLKMLCDFSELDEGSIEIFGIDHRRTQARERLAFLPEQFQAPYFALGIDFLRYVQSLHGLNYDPEPAAAECASLEFDVADLGRPVDEYSKGMQQKLGLIACLLADRDLLVLDEPMSGLDPKARALFITRLKALQTSGSTILFTTHLLDDIAQLCDRLAVLDGGRLRFEGTAAAFRAEFSADTLEAAFLSCLESSIHA